MLRPPAFAPTGPSAASIPFRVRSSTRRRLCLLPSFLTRHTGKPHARTSPQQSRSRRDPLCQPFLRLYPHANWRPPHLGKSVRVHPRALDKCVQHLRRRHHRRPKPKSRGEASEFQASIAHSGGRCRRRQSEIVIFPLCPRLCLFEGPWLKLLTFPSNVRSGNAQHRPLKSVISNLEASEPQASIARAGGMCRRRQSPISRRASLKRTSPAPAACAAGDNLQSQI
jgi:hypothetical protein